MKPRFMKEIPLEITACIQKVVRYDGKEESEYKYQYRVTE